MRYQIGGGGWPIGAVLIPAGTIISLDNKAEHQLTEWERLARGRIPPMDAIALDQEAWEAMAQSYEHHRIITGPDVVRTPVVHGRRVARAGDPLGPHKQ